jgi:predicted ATP-grasp superfamily ATP-dependent carboligase
MRIIIYEHVSGGGYCGKPIPPMLLAEAFAMLRCITKDFKAAGHTVTVLLDSRLSVLNPPLDADFMVPIFYPSEFELFLRCIAQINDAIYIIAPETSKVLEDLLNQIEQMKIISLNCKSKAVGKVSSKSELYESLEKAGFLIPKTLVFERGISVELLKSRISEVGFPLVFKPAVGAGACGLSLVKNESQIDRALEKILAEPGDSRFLVQEFIEGKSVSASLFSNGKKAVPVSLNEQLVQISGVKEDSYYQGGVIPFEHALKDDAFALAEKAVSLFEGLRGYIGVDLILTKKAVLVVDINPRLTTSFVGLSTIASFNLAEALLNSIISGELPKTTPFSGFSYFSKHCAQKLSIESYRETLKLQAVISPPFPLEEAEISCSLILGHDKTVKDACLALEESKKQLDTIIS